MHADPPFQSLDPGERSAFGVIACRNQHSRDHQLEVQPGRRGPRHLGEGSVDNIGGTAQLGLTEDRRLLSHAVELVSLDSAQNGCRRIRRSAVPRGTTRHSTHDDEVAQPLQQVFDKTPGVLTGLNHTVDRLERGWRVVNTERIDDLTQESGVGVSQKGHRAFVAHRGFFRPGDELIEQRQRVSHAATARAHDEGKHPRLDRHPLGLAELLHIVEHLRGGHEAKRIVVRAGTDGTDHLVGLGGRENELDVLWRLFDDLEQGVEPLRRHHVSLVEDENLEAIAGRGEHRTLAQIAGVVDPVVAGSVDFHHIQRPRSVTAQLDATGAGTAGGVGRPHRAVETPSQDARGCCLATPTRTAEEVGVVDAVVAKRRAQRIGHLRLADELGE